MVDADSDGWDDAWATKYPGVDASEPMADLNGDGMPAYLEMALGLDPFAKNPAPGTKLDARAKRLRAKIKGMERARARHAPWLNRGLRDDSGKPTTRAQRRAARQIALDDKLDEQRIKVAARQQRVDDFMRDYGDKLPEPLRNRRPADVVDGRPEWNSALNVRQADENFVLRHLWPGGIIGETAFPYNWDLTGSGRVLAMWDTGSVDASHEQFDPDGAGGAPSRVQNLDPGVAINDHATAVAAILVGAGDPSILEPGNINSPPGSIPFPEQGRGISYGSTLLAYDNDEDLFDMLLLLSNPTVDLRLSNHSYGTICGWQRPQGSFDWFWYGHLIHRLEGTREDYKLGAYRSESVDIDDLVHTAQTYLPVWASGNDSANLSGQAPEPDDHGPRNFSQISHTVFPLGFPAGTLLTSAEVSANSLERDDDGRDIGNPRDEFDTILPQACSKNVLTVSSRNARGPTDDGRIKPDLLADDDGSSAYLANSYGEITGSSFAAPVVTGGLNLILELWDQRRGITADSPLASTLKAIAIAGPGRKVGPTYEIGWGRFNAWTSAQLLHFDTEPEVLHSHQIIKETVMEDGDTIEFHILRDNTNENGGFQQNPPINNSGAPDFGNSIAVTLCWTDPAGSQAILGMIDDNTSRLVNDLDMTIEGPLPTTTLHEPWILDPENPSQAATTGDNDRDNVEQVLIPGDGSSFGIDGLYKVTIKLDPDQMALVGSQPVSIVIVGALAVDIPFRILAIDPTGVGGDYTIQWGSNVGATYGIERSSDLITWQSTSVDIVAIKEITSHVVQATPGANREFFRVIQLD